MSDEHKAALAEGRNQGRAVRRYLEALEAHKPKRGRKRTPNRCKSGWPRSTPSCRRRPAQARCSCVQERLDLQAELEAAERDGRPPALETEFVEARPRPTAQRKGISYAAWREVGVAPAVLKKAGISRVPS